MQATQFSVRRLLSTLAALIAVGAVSHAQMGHVLNGVGPVNQSMGGAAPGVAVDASGALHWNSASIAGLGHNEFTFGFELLIPDATVQSSITSPGPMSGSSSSDAGDSPIPSFGFVFNFPNSRWVFGLGAYGLSGFGVDYAASSSNPILMPPPNGFGSIYSQFQMLQIAPTFAYKLDDHWSVGVAPTVNQAQLAINPASFSSPNGDGTYPDGRSAAKTWGFGAQVGLYYQNENGFSAGLSHKTTQDFDKFKFNSTDASGGYRPLSFDMDFPAITSLGVGYSGEDDLKLAADVRYIDYANTNGFDTAKFNPDFSVNGFGWDSILVLAVGAQYRFSEHWQGRIGYSFNENPIPDATSTYNIPAPAVIQHHLSLGIGHCFTENTCLDFGYRHGFENSIEGPMVDPATGNSVPGTSVKNSLSSDSFLVGFRLSF